MSPLLPLLWLACGSPSAEPTSATTEGAPAAAPTPPPPPPAPPPPVSVVDPGARRIVAVGDLHGDPESALQALQLLGVADPSGHWAGGDAILVQTGDTTDRGPDSHGVMALLRRLQAEAPAAGGLVVPLLGNHEVMNLRGDLRYVSPEDYASYGGPEARATALGPAGEDGRWLRSLGVSAKVGDTVFCHGGITPAWGLQGVEALNAKASAALDAPGKPAVLGEDGPLWYRGYVQDPEEQACPALATALLGLRARRMVVGHTTRDDGLIQSRCGGQLLVIDIGVSKGYGGHVGALELREGTDAWASYPAGPVDLPDPK